MSLISELRRRNVFRVAIAYGIAAWLVLQLADVVLDNTAAPDWVIQVIMLLLVIGFPIAVIFAWALELTPDGIKKEKDVDRSASLTQHTGRKLDYAIIGVLVVALGFFVFDKFASGTGDDASGIAAESSDVNAKVIAASVPEPVVPLIAEKSIAVLPFVNMSNDPDQEYFSDGISEELLNVLAKFPDVRVAARTSSFQFKGQNQDIGEIARLLKVNHVLEGSVRKAGNKLRITAQLIEASSGYHLWSETYDRELDDVFAIQDEISAAIGDALRVELALGEDQKALPQVAETANTAAYEAFLRGRHLVNQRGRKNIYEAEGYLERSIRLDPDYAPAHAWLAIAINLLLASPASYGDYTLKEVVEKATPHVERAFELDPDLAEAHGAVALMALNTPDFELAMSETAKALELNPVYVDAMNWRQLAANAFGDMQTQLDGMQRIVEVDPLSVVGRSNYSGVLALKDLEAGRAMALSIMPQNKWSSFVTSAYVEYETGDLSAAMKLSLQGFGEDSEDEYGNILLLQLFSYLGEYEEARRVPVYNYFQLDMEQNDFESATHSLRTAITEDPENIVLMTDLADVLHQAGQLDESLAYYEKVKHFRPSGVIVGSSTYASHSNVRMAYALKMAGKPELAKEALEVHNKHFANLAKAGVIANGDFAAEAMAKAVEGDEQVTFEAIRKAVDKGYRVPSFFNEPVFDSIKTHPEFLSLRAEMAQILKSEHEQVLTLICTDNPIPESWRPLKETCLGVTAGP